MKAKWMLLVAFMVVAAVAVNTSCAAQSQAKRGENAERAIARIPRGVRPPLRPPTYEDVKYGPHERNVLDFYQAESDKPTPLAVFIHGGAFRAGSKRGLNQAVLQELLAAGISVAAIEYRLVPEYPLPTAHHDSLRALQFICSKAAEWNIDKKRIGAFGGSAGAQICMWLAFHDEMAEPSSRDPVQHESSRLTCVATNGGQTTMDRDWMMRWIPGFEGPRGPGKAFGEVSEEQVRSMWKDLSALSLITKDDPPIFMSYFMSPQDPVPTNSKRAQMWKVHHVMYGVKLKEKMDELGVEADLQYPGAKTKYNSLASFLIAKLKTELGYLEGSPTLKVAQTDEEIKSLYQAAAAGDIEKAAPKVLMFIRDHNDPRVEYMLINEVDAMRGILKQSGLEVIIATISGDVIETETITLKPNMKLEDVNIDDYAGFIMPCLTNNSAPPEAVNFVQRVVDKGKPLAAQVGAIFVLREAGVRTRRRFGSGVSQDGMIIISTTCPWLAKETGREDGTAKLTRMLIDTIGEGSSSQESDAEPANPLHEAEEQNIRPTHSDEKYGDHVKHAFDLYLVDSDRPTPLFIWIHGGGFRGGDKRGVNRDMIGRFAQHGVSFASMNYRLTDVGPYPMQMLDAARGLQTIRHRAKQYNIDPTRIACGGGSAGAGISMWLLYHDDLADKTSNDPIARQSTRITCAVGINGQTTLDPRVIQKLFDTNQVSGPLIPFFSMKHDKDLARPELIKLFEDASIINHTTADDPPLYLFYSQANRPLPINSTDQQHIHHPKFGSFLKDKTDKLRLEVVLKMREDYESANPNKIVQDQVDWVLKHFGIEPKETD